MLKRNLCTALILSALILIATAAVAQTPNAIYRLEFTVLENEGAKKVSSRTYTMLVEEGKRGSIRVGSRVPVSTGGTGQFNYIDVGVNIDAFPKIVDATSLRLDSTIELTSIVTQEGASKPPVLRNSKGSFGNVIPLDKTVTITTQDDPAANTTLTVQVMAKVVK